MCNLINIIITVSRYDKPKVEQITVSRNKHVPIKWLIVSIVWLNGLFE